MEDKEVKMTCDESSSAFLLANSEDFHSQSKEAWSIHHNRSHGSLQPIRARPGGPPHQLALIG